MSSFGLLKRFVYGLFSTGESEEMGRNDNQLTVDEEIEELEARIACSSDAGFLDDTGNK